MYTNNVQPYFRAPQLYVAFPARYTERKEWTANYDALCGAEHRKWRMQFHPRYGLAVTDGLFMTSRDGKSFRRWNEAFLRPGPESPKRWVYGDGYAAYGLIATPTGVPWGVYGIHGTNRPDSIGANASHGCIRLRVADAEALYAMVPNGTRVYLEGGPYGPLGDSLRTLRPGDRGSHVREVQLRLRQQGFLHGSADGVYGEATSRAVLAARNVNIVDISQTVMKDFFTMTMLADLAEATVPFDELRQALSDKGGELGLSIRIQNEDIFNAMHRI